MDTAETDTPTNRPAGNGGDWVDSATRGSTGSTSSSKQRPTSRGLDNITLASTSGHADPPLQKSDDSSPAVNNKREPDTTPSRASITQSLGSKDPTWFRQTSDRGVASPAYRKAQGSETISTEGNPRLPGLGRERSAESERQGGFNHESERSGSPSRTGSIYGAGNFTDRYSGVSSATAGGLGSPMPLSSSRRLESHASSIDADPQDAERVAMSPSQGRLTGERPSSPTKGLGGFVQSAMLRRSDSVSKRWSGSVTAGNRGEEGQSKLNQRMPGKPIEEGTHEASKHQSNFRPGSGHSDANVNRQSTDNDVEGKSTTQSNRNDSNDGFVKPALPSRPASRSDSVASGGKPGESPYTPSKTMDSRRWSPTKASWLESALNKPESPKPKSQPAPQPEWKKDNPTLKQTKPPVQSPKPSRIDDTTSTGKGHLPDSEHNFSGEPVASDGTDKLNSGQTRGKTSSGAVSHSFTPSLKSSESTPPASAVENGTSPGRSSTDPKAMAKDSTSLDKAIASKSKPPSPPSKDLRTNLRRSETTPTGPKETNEPEFKNVLGKLRKAETKNYVAPDDLKDNILRGKAALNQTGGPQKSQRVDEFKDSILKQKQAMKSGGGSIKGNTVEDKKDSPGSASPVPEAIARRNTMNRPESRTSNPSISDVQAKLPVTSPDTNSIETADLSKTDGDATTVSSGDKTSYSTREETKTHETPSFPEKAIEKPTIQTRSPEQSPVVSSVDASKEYPSPSSASKGGLAERLNPGLAGFLSRGSPAEPKISPSASPPKFSSAPDSDTTLTHMTKSRAKGPKRRRPQGNDSDKIKPTSEPPASPNQSSKPTLSKLSLPAQEDHLLTDATPSESPSARARSSGILEAIRKRTPVEPPVGEQFPFPSDGGQGAGGVDGIPGSPPELLPATRYSGPIQPLAKQEPSNPVSASPPMSSKASDKPPTPPKRTNAPSRLNSVSSPKPDLPQPSAKASHDRVETTPTVIDSADSSNRKAPPPPLKKPSFSLDNRSESPQVPPKPKLVSSTKSAEPYKTSPQSSPVPRTSEASRIFSSFFDAPPKASDKVEIDPQPILLPKSDDSPKINTVRKQIWEVMGDGRKMELPSNQECTLFEDSMYLCVHVFEVPKGTKTTQVHLWCGDGVSEAAIEDAQLFARKVARENSSKLELLKQGKEPFSFIQALGGIIITRRGSSSRATSSGSYMLCGRRHMGQISFDEVDLDAACLCSGYPYIISGKFGKPYLWQGKGSAVDELGCARLIGMGLGLTGEIGEVTEGEEPQEFLEAFPGAGRPATYHSADYWQLKPNQSKYRNRLFRVDNSQGQRFSAGFWNRRGTSSPTRPNSMVQEIEPFCQRDLEPGHIYILDAFFEIYV